MPVKKPSKKKAAKKKAKPRIKTAICTDNDSREIFEGYVDCPYCKDNQFLEGIDMPPIQHKCDECGKTFKIQWE